MAASRSKMQEAKKNGRPTDFNQEMADRICDLVASTTHGLSRLCELYPDLPVKSTINLWRYKHPSFSALYAQAKIVQADLLAEECLDIADDSSNDTIIDPEGYEKANTEYIARSRLRVDTRKWLAAKLLPKQYGAAVDAGKTVSDTVVEKLIDKLIE